MTKEYSKFVSKKICADYVKKFDDMIKAVQNASREQKGVFAKGLRSLPDYIFSKVRVTTDQSLVLQGTPEASKLKTIMSWFLLNSITKSATQEKGTKAYDLTNIYLNENLYFLLLQEINTLPVI